MQRLSIGLICVAAVALPAPAAARASTVSVGPAGLSFAGAAGEQNDVTVSTRGVVDPQGWLVNDATAPLTAGAGCTGLDTHTASCDAAAGQGRGVSVDLGDGDDVASVRDACGNVEGGCGSVVRGGAGRDVVFGADMGESRLFGDAGEDELHAGQAPAVMHGGRNADSLLGSPHDDLLYGDHGPDWLRGFGGNDRLSGGKEFDVVNGGRGNDRMSGGTGRDTFVGSTGNDTIDAVDNGWLDTIFGGRGSDSASIDGRDHTHSVERIRRR